MNANEWHFNSLAAVAHQFAVHLERASVCIAETHSVRGSRGCCSVIMLFKKLECLKRQQLATPAWLVAEGNSPTAMTFSSSAFCFDGCAHTFTCQNLLRFMANTLAVTNSWPS
jgi:hypothetical protein